MNEDTTKDLSKKYDTKPTIETVLERISDMRGEMLERMNEMRSELSGEINGMRSEMNGIRGEMNGIRGEMNGMRGELSGEINKLRDEMSGEIKKLRAEMHVGFDRVESIATGTRAEFLTLRADFRELKQALVEHIPALKT
jgi:uncharacterized coiled-coil DUF342 family protein